MVSDIELDTLPTIIRHSVQQISSSELKSPPDHSSISLDHSRLRSVASNQLGQETTSASSAQQTKEQAIRSRAQFIVTCCCMFAIGFNDASAGPLLPRMQSVYQISFLIVSLLFIFACVGFILGACLNVLVSDHVTFGKVTMCSCILQMIAFTLAIPAPPFPVFVLGYFINGIGSALQIAQVNGYLVVMGHNVNLKVALSQASYGAGAFVAPLVATQFSAMRHWSFHYLVSLSMVTTNAFLTSAIFRLQSKEDCRAQLGLEAMEPETSEHSPFRQIMNLKSVHILAAFIFLYVGTEVTIGGWTVTYIIQQRDAGVRSGYIASGFWGGILLGRIILIPLNNWLGDRLVMLIYIVLAIGLEIVVWLVPSLIGNAVAVSLVGLFFGPMFPVALSASRKVIPRWIYTGAIGWITGIGQAGSAALPFLTGALADAVGISSLQPLLVGMMSAMIAMWLLVPRPTRPD
ncbi:major facilitator superfamily domain-containing protein [Lentinula edodes]|uniref:Major facilitator superfamily domain-containing protein n=1 Tax=Lentinula lateritia TaxID=40482 RepID=A0A9W9A2J9_9AGAR|nr:major facilitator superfamily domain-containing protein [Lentinula edodes]